MPKYKITLSYDGTGYGGWQVQPNSTSIQSLVQKALTTILREETFVTGSGRTDAGVHALGQVAHFQTDKAFKLSSLQYSLNSLLPEQIRILHLEPIADSFHARYSATGKIYHYHLHLDRTLNPFTRLYSLHVHHRVDATLLQEAASCFLGTKDFSAFANEAHRGSASIDAVRTLQRLDVVPESGGVRLELEADGFLYKMVRNITGTLLDICAGHISISAIPEIFDSKNRGAAGKTAPAHGLFLIKVHY
ncbi:MAG: tRNA pseudouridine(38-40) synthase TruA [Rhabdochlamydiaceae bacterium]|nr:tRNA pseudouridine(38-40) synthase TruA [Rhabdochlamydiaceae bacterium]